MICLVTLFVFTPDSAVGSLKAFTNFHSSVGKFGLHALISCIIWFSCDCVAGIYTLTLGLVRMNFQSATSRAPVFTCPTLTTAAL